MKCMLLIPAFNESQNIRRVLEELIEIAPDVDIVVVNDGSSDDTATIVRSFEGIRLLSHPFNLGYGAALQLGYKYGCEKDYDYIIQYDSDGQHLPKYVTKLLEELKKEEYDMVIGSRFILSSEEVLGSKKISKIKITQYGEIYMRSEDMPVGKLKVMVIKLMRFLIQRMTKQIITDPTSGFKGLTRKAFCHFSKEQSYPTDYPDADIIIHMLLREFRVKEIPITSRTRTFGVSMHSGIKPLIYVLNMILSILAVYLESLFERGRNRGI